MKLEVGLSVSSERSFTLQEVQTYCSYSLDTNPVHYDAQKSKEQGFDGILVPGLLVASLFGGLMGTRLPGFGTVHLYQDVRFERPVYVDEKVKAVLTVEKIRYDKPIVTYTCVAYKADGTIAMQGTGVVKVPKQYI